MNKLSRLHLFPYQQSALDDLRRRLPTMTDEEKEAELVRLGAEARAEREGREQAAVSKQEITKLIRMMDDGPYEPPPKMEPGGKLAPCGRNDKCPCGSGKKYKRCCIGGKGVAIKGGLQNARNRS